MTHTEQVLQARVAAPGTVIDWTRPAGKPDWLMGTGTTSRERLLVWAITGVGLVAGIWLGSDQWHWWQWAVVVFLVVDVVGGVTANALSTAKRQYHGPSPAHLTGAGRVLRSSRLFTLAHLHPFLVAIALPDATWTWALYWYLGCLAAVLLVHAVPLYLQRPTAFAALTALLMVAPAVAAPEGLMWFGPVLAVKLVAAHAVREEPYRPAPRQAVSA